MMTIRSIRLRSPTGTLLWQWSAREGMPLPVRNVSPNTLVQQGGVVLAATADPWVVLDVPEDVRQQLEAKAQLELDGLWQPLSQEVAKVAIEGTHLD